MIPTHCKTGRDTRRPLFFISSFFFLVTLFLLPRSLDARAVSIDGELDEGEYDNSIVRGNGEYRLAWTVSGGYVYFAVSAVTEGWVAIGFDPIVVTDNADMIFGWVDDKGEAHVLDARSQGAYGPYVPDDKLGGSNDIHSFAGTESSGETTIEFSRRLSTGDPNDSDIRTRSGGGNKLIWMYGSSDDYTQRYLNLGYAWLQSSGERGQRGSLSGTGGFIFSTTAALLLIASGMFVIGSMRQKRWWSMFNSITGSVGALCGIASAAFSVYWMTAGEGALRYVHFGLGTALIPILVVFLAGKFLLHAGQSGAAAVMIHRVFQLLSLLLLLVSLFIGLIRTGIL